MARLTRNGGSQHTPANDAKGRLMHKQAPVRLPSHAALSVISVIELSLISYLEAFFLDCLELSSDENLD